MYFIIVKYSHTHQKLLLIDEKTKIKVQLDLMENRNLLFTTFKDQREHYIRHASIISVEFRDAEEPEEKEIH